MPEIMSATANLPPSDPPAIVATDGRPMMTADEADRLTREPAGVSALLVQLRFNRVTMEVAIEAINRSQSRPTNWAKRMILAIAHAVAGR